MSESEGKVLSYTSDSGPTDKGTKLVFLDRPVPAAMPVFAPSAAKRQIKNLTPAQIRAQKIRGLLSKFSSRPDLETYCDWMDRAKIQPPPVCRSAGLHTFADSLKIERFKQAVSAEFSRLWHSRKK